MRKMWKRIAAAAMTACMSLGLATTAAAYQWHFDDGAQGEMVQYVMDHENNVYAPYVVQLVAVGTVIEFSEPVDVAIYAEGEYGAYAPVLVEKGVTSYTVPDAQHTYVFTAADGARSLFRGTTTQQAPVLFVGDIQYGAATLKLSKPVVDIDFVQLERYDYETGKGHNSRGTANCCR